MNKNQESKLGSYKRILSLLDSNNALIAVLATLFNIFNAFKNKVAEIVLCVQHQEDSILGYTKEKAKKREELSEITLMFAGALRSYFSLTGNNELYSKAEITMTEMEHTRDEDLVPVCQIIYNLADTNISNLGGYGIDGVKLAVFQNLLETYDHYSQRPLEVRSQRHEYTIELKRLFHEADVLLNEQLDSGMLVFRGSQPKLYASYLEARRIFEQGSHKRKIAVDDNVGYLMVKVLNGADGSPISGAKVMLDTVNEWEESDEDSEAYLEKVPTGAHKLIVSCEGYKTYEMNLTIEPGDEMNLEILLEAETDGTTPDPEAESAE